MRRTMLNVEIPIVGTSGISFKTIRGKLVEREYGPVKVRFILHENPDEKDNTWRVTEVESGAACVRAAENRRAALFLLGKATEDKTPKHIRWTIRKAINATERTRDMIEWQDEIREMLDIELGAYLSSYGVIDFKKLAARFQLAYHPGKAAKAVQMHICRMSAHPRRYHVSGKFEQWEAEQRDDNR